MPTSRGAVAVCAVRCFSCLFSLVRAFLWADLRVSRLAEIRLCPVGMAHQTSSVLVAHIARDLRKTREKKTTSDGKQGRGRLARVNGGFRCLPMTEIEREGAWSVRLSAPSLVLVEIATRRRRTTRTPRARLRRRSEMKEGCLFQTTLGIAHSKLRELAFVRLEKRPPSVVVLGDRR